MTTQPASKEENIKTINEKDIHNARNGCFYFNGLCSRKET